MTDSSTNSSATAPTCFFVTDGKSYVPTRLARGPWGPSISGNYVGGLLGRTVEQDVDDVDLQPARLTVDLLRPVALKPAGTASDGQPDMVTRQVAFIHS